jgi:hypothetical protein
LTQLASELVGRGKLGRVGSHPTIVPGEARGFWRSNIGRSYW